MGANYYELTTQLWDLLTKDEIIRGETCVTCDCGIGMWIKTGSSMVEKVLAESPWRDHIIGFKRENNGIDLVLDEEGQAKWKKREDEIQAWCDKYGSD